MNDEFFLNNLTFEEDQVYLETDFETVDDLAYEFNFGWYQGNLWVIDYAGHWNS